MGSPGKKLEEQRDAKNKKHEAERNEREDVEELRKLFRACSEETVVLINQEPFDRALVAANIAQLKEVFNDMAYCMTSFHLRFFKDLIKNLEEQLKKRIEIDKKKTKSTFSFQAKFRFTSIKSRPEESQSPAPLDTPTEQPDAFQLQVAETAGVSGQKIDLTQADIKDTYRLRDLTDCEVRIAGKLKTLYLENLVRCRVVCGIIEGSLFGNRLQESQVEAVAHQIRIHNAVATRFSIFVTSNMIIEDSREVVIAPLAKEKLTADFGKTFEESKYASADNQWRSVKDFNWIRDEPSPNFTYLE